MRLTYPVFTSATDTGSKWVMGKKCTKGYRGPSEGYDMVLYVILALLVGIIANSLTGCASRSSSQLYYQNLYRNYCAYKLDPADADRPVEEDIAQMRYFYERCRDSYIIEGVSPPVEETR